MNHWQITPEGWHSLYYVQMRYFLIVFWALGLAVGGLIVAQREPAARQLVRAIQVSNTAIYGLLMLVALFNLLGPTWHTKYAWDASGYIIGAMMTVTAAWWLRKRTVALRSVRN